ncbi:hypothetical protein WOLCODRAFT_153947 [Wolfiporia cocos MD-104 SS10]|uniref:Uncharacterized protein n=1 Tax=Wolfiporia cocos (strain MD-104) TaxID=742152 RepID=A0A2H3K636_WOLCO|nr:hypothetical protein WOLCODRAFT_153947 [Wolfiporia cocos MD-104 SS10]
MDVDGCNVDSWEEGARRNAGMMCGGYGKCAATDACGGRDVVGRPGVPAEGGACLKRAPRRTENAALLRTAGSSSFERRRRRAPTTGRAGCDAMCGMRCDASDRGREVDDGGSGDSTPTRRTQQQRHVRFGGDPGPKSESR